MNCSMNGSNDIVIMSKEVLTVLMPSLWKNLIYMIDWVILFTDQYNAQIQPCHAHPHSMKTNPGASYSPEFSGKSKILGFYVNDQTSDAGGARNAEPAFAESIG